MKRKILIRIEMIIGRKNDKKVMIFRAVFIKIIIVRKKLIKMQKKMLKNQGKRRDSFI
jgi:hypothetical protein